MRSTTKLLPVLLLGSALAGCSMAGTGDYFADSYNQTGVWGQSGQYLDSGCYQVGVAPEVNHVAPSAPSCGQVAQYTHAQYAPQYSQPVAAQPTYVQPAQTYTQPAYTQPAYVQPNYAQPTYVEPTYVQPSYAQGSYVPPVAAINGLGLRGKQPASGKYFYGTLGGINYDLGEDLYGVQGRLGYQFSPLIGAEVEGSLGVVDDTDPLALASGAIVDQNFDVDKSIAGFGVLRYPVLGNLSALTRVGYHRTDIDATLIDAAGVETPANFEVDGIAFGGGLEYAVSPKTSIRADYTVYDFDGENANSLALAVARKF